MLPSLHLANAHDCPKQAFFQHHPVSGVLLAQQTGGCPKRHRSASPSALSSFYLFLSLSLSVSLATPLSLSFSVSLSPSPLISLTGLSRASICLNRPVGKIKGDGAGNYLLWGHPRDPIEYELQTVAPKIIWACLFHKGTLFGVGLKRDQKENHIYFLGGIPFKKVTRKTLVFFGGGFPQTKKHRHLGGVPGGFSKKSRATHFSPPQWAGSGRRAIALQGRALELDRLIRSNRTLGGLAPCVFEIPFLLAEKRDMTWSSLVGELRKKQTLF